MNAQNRSQKYLKIAYLVLGSLIILIASLPFFLVSVENQSIIHSENSDLKVSIESVQVNKKKVNGISKEFQQPDVQPNDTIKIVLLLKNHGSNELFILNPGNFGYINAQLYSFSDDDVIGLQTGKLLKIEDREFRSYKPILPLKLKSNQPYRLTLLCTQHLPQFQPRKLLFTFRTYDRWVKSNYFRYASQGLFIGCIIVMALYNLLLFFAVRDVSYLYYVLSIIGVGLYFSFYYGFTLEFLWPSYPRWDAYSFGVVLPLTGVARALFTKAYLKPEIHNSLWDKILNTLTLLYIIPVTLTIWSLFYGEAVATIIVYLIGILGNIVLLTMLVSGFFAHFNGYKPAKFFILANLFFIVGGILFILREIEILPSTMFTIYAVQVGILAQVILFSLGLADRLNRMRLQLAQDQLQLEIIARKEEFNRKQKLKKQKEELEELVSLRTSDLTHKKQELENTVTQLKQSQLELKSTNRVKDKMFTLIAHDLRAPLATFDSFLTILNSHLDEMSNEKRRKLVVSTKSSLQSMNILLDNLLKWSRSQISPAIANPDTVDINKVIKKTIRLFRFALVSKNIRLNINLDAEGLVYTDKNMIETVIRNLINNAIKFTPKGKIIEISTFGKANSLYFKIFNSSPEISPEFVQQISKFDGIFKTKGTDNEKGYGLGLMLCNEFVTKNKGELKAEIVKGKGIVFSVFLPRFKSN